jgi:hypothetical protein
MKKLLLPIIIAFLGTFNTSLLAQPTLTAASNNLKLFDQWLLSDLTIGSAEFSTGALAGSNKIWNFAGIPLTTSRPVEILMRNSAPKPTSYPAANMVVKVGSEYSYIESNNSVLKEHAAYDMQNYSLENTDPLEKMHFPITFNNTFSDTFSGTVNLGGTIIPRTGIVTVTAEGYGTLITQSSTFQNVLKVKTEEIANPQTSFSENAVTYDWYLPGIPFSLFRMTRRITMAGTVYTGFYNHIIYAGSKEDLASQLNLQIFPNPATSELTVQFKNNASDRVKLSLLNMLGQEIAELPGAENSAESQTIKVNVAAYPKGIYILKLEGKDKVTTKRIVIE